MPQFDPAFSMWKSRDGRLWGSPEEASTADAQIQPVTSVRPQGFGRPLISSQPLVASRAPSTVVGLNPLAQPFRGSQSLGSPNISPALVPGAAALGPLRMSRPVSAGGFGRQGVLDSLARANMLKVDPLYGEPIPTTPNTGVVKDVLKTNRSLVNPSQPEPPEDLYRKPNKNILLSR